MARQYACGFRSIADWGALSLFVGVPSSLEYVDPWLESGEARMLQLRRKRRRIAYFYEFPDTSTFRYRVFNPGKTLAADSTSETSAAWFDLRDLSKGLPFINMADALVLCRTRYNAPVASLIARARRRGIPVIFDCDDLVFGTERVHLLLDSLNLDVTSEQVWDEWFAYCGRLAATMRLCDAYIGTNDYLTARARDVQTGLDTRVMRNYLNPQQQALSEKIYDLKKKNGWGRDDRIHIGYFSGSPSHKRDFDVAAPAIARLMERNPRVVLRIVGFLSPGPNLARFGDRIETYPLQDFLNLQRLIGEVEINVAPLQENSFTNCKSELKFFEAAICGTLTLATPTFSFKESMIHGETGLLVPAQNWDLALRRAVELVEDRDAYAGICEAAFRQVKATYGWNNQSRMIEKAVFG